MMKPTALDKFITSAPADPIKRKEALEELVALRKALHEALVVGGGGHVRDLP